MKLDGLRSLVPGRGSDGIDPEDAGLLEGLRDDREREARARLVEQLAADGATVEELREAVSRDRLALLPLERALATNGDEHFTLTELAKRSGVEEDFLRALRRALGLPSVAPGLVGGSESDLEAAETVQRFREAGLPDEGLLEIARVLGHGMSLVAATIHRVITQAFLQPGDTELDTALRYADVARQLRPELAPLLEYALRVHQEEQIGSEVMAKTDLESGHLAGTENITVCFADLVGFTQLGQAIAPAGLGAIAGRLTDLAVECARPPVRLVKMIGDAALLVSPEPDALLMAALELMEAASADDELPPLRVGIARGHAVTRGGEWFGPPVNLASRLTAAARPGCVLASAELRDTVGTGYLWSKPRRRALAGVKTRVEVAEVRLGAASAEEPWPGYEEQTVREIRPLLTAVDTAMLTRVLRFERRHKRRKGVIAAAQAQRRPPR